MILNRVSKKTDKALNCSLTPSPGVCPYVAWWNGDGSGQINYPEDRSAVVVSFMEVLGEIRDPDRGLSRGCTGMVTRLCASNERSAYQIRYIKRAGDYASQLNDRRKSGSEIRVKGRTGFAVVCRFKRISTGLSPNPILVKSGFF